MNSVSVQKQNLLRKLIVAYLVASILPMLFLTFLFIYSKAPEMLFYSKSLDLESSLPFVLLIGIPSILLLSFTGFLILFFTIKPIQSLTKDVGKVITKMGGSPALLNTDEIDKLSSSFLAILDELRNKVAELEAYSGQLSSVNKQLLEMSIIDELTGLYNLRYFRKRLMEELDRSARYRHDLCLIMFDIDDFKIINDSYGHATGNAVLRRLGLLTRSLVRKCDIVIRYGGDEFALILPETNLKGGIKLAHHLRREIAQHTFTTKDKSGDPIKISASFGLATYNGQISDIDELIRRADSYLYAAKREGKNCIGSELLESQQKVSGGE